MVAGKFCWLLAAVGTIVMCAASTDIPWCTVECRPVINICTQEQMNNTKELYIDTVKASTKEAKCPCIIDKINSGDIYIPIRFKLLNNSHLNYGQSFYFKNDTVLNKTLLEANTTFNKKEILSFMKHKTPHPNPVGGACLHITSDVPISVECKPPDKLKTIDTTKVPPSKPSTASVTRIYNVTQRIAEDSDPISEKVLPIGITLALLIMALIVIGLSILRYRRKRRGHCKTETQQAEQGGHAVELMTDKVDEEEHYAEPNDNTKYEEVDNIEDTSNARGTNNAMPVDKPANEYGFIMKEGPSNSTYDHVQRKKAHQKHTDNIYNRFKDIDHVNDTYNSTNASMALNNKTACQNSEENVYHVLEKQ